MTTPISSTTPKVVTETSTTSFTFSKTETKSLYTESKQDKSTDPTPKTTAQTPIPAPERNMKGFTINISIDLLALMTEFAKTAAETTETNSKANRLTMNAQRQDAKAQGDKIAGQLEKQMWVDVAVRVVTSAVTIGMGMKNLNALKGANANNYQVVAAQITTRDTLTKGVTGLSETAGGAYSKSLEADSKRMEAQKEVHTSYQQEEQGDYQRNEEFKKTMLDNRKQLLNIVMQTGMQLAGNVGKV
ncbi:hypothetical protein [Pleionea sp. CnH1-48]|uniref:hypothetical protein n=1 Tax=Pleionea sp. CnH1-48 TaxID=2954494 RepID=UPI0020972BD4|nr:hypothetical protein [Pleionea sp. CnH1-48]MCO7226998.1 hypothetical protein [Pleionea sp. CnH1-48]